MVSLQDLFTLPRKSVASFGEVLPWFGMVSLGTVLCTDGSLLAGYSFQGFDIEGVEDDQINKRVDLLETAMRQLSDRVTMYSFLEKRNHTEYPAATFSNAVARAIDDAWGRQITAVPHARFHHTIYLSFRYPNRTEAFFEQLRVELEQHDSAMKAFGSVLRQRFTERSAVAGLRGQLAEMIEEFENVTSAFANIVVSSLGFQRLEGENLLGDLYGRANLGSERGPIAVPDRPAYLNSLLPSDDLVRQGDMLEFRGPAKSTYCAALSITGMPSFAMSSQVDRLLSLPCEYVVVQSFQFLDRTMAQASIQDAEQFYRTEVKSAMVRVFERVTGTESEKINTGNLALAQDAQDALVEITAGDTSFGYYNMTVLALGDSGREVSACVDAVSSALRASGFGVTRERQGLMSAFLGSLPGNSRTLLRRYLVSGSNVADLAPIRSATCGTPSHELFSKILGRTVPAHIRFMTSYGVPYDFNTHSSDLGHTVVVGGAGSGKSTAMTLLLSMFQKYYPCKTYIFDKDHSIALATTLLGGKNLDLASPGGAGVKCNPVKRMLGDGDTLALVRWLNVLMTSEGASLSPEDQEVLSEQVEQLKSLGEPSWRLSTLYSLLHGSNRRLALKLAPYVDRSSGEGSYAKGAFSEFFDNEEDDLSFATITCMETGKLLQSPEIAAPFMDYAFYCIEKGLDGRTPTFIYVEECWYMLSNETFEAKMDDWLRTFRKKRAFVVFATQSPEELARLKSWAAFVSNVPTRIFLPSINDSVSALTPIYQSLFNLNSAQLDLLSQAVPKRDYLITKPGGETKLVSAHMPEVLIAINEGTTRPDIRKAALDAAKEYEGHDWQVEFIREVLHVDI